MSLDDLIDRYTCKEYETCGDDSSLIVRDLSKRQSATKIYAIPKGTTSTLAFGPVILSISMNAKQQRLYRMVYRGGMYPVSIMKKKGGFILTAMRRKVVKAIIIIDHVADGLTATIDGIMYTLVKKDAH